MPKTALIREHGRVLNVADEQRGSTLVQDELAGATTLHLDDVTDFDEHGGLITVLGVTYRYDKLDDDLDTLHLTTGLIVNAADLTPVLVSPAVFDRWAVVRVDDVFDTSEGTYALVPFGLYASLPPGQRDQDGNEWVTLVKDGDTWKVQEVTSDDTGAVGGHASSGTGGTGGEIHARVQRTTNQTVHSYPATPAQVIFTDPPISDTGGFWDPSFPTRLTNPASLPPGSRVSLDAGTTYAPNGLGARFCQIRKTFAGGGTAYLASDIRPAAQPGNTTDATVSTEDDNANPGDYYELIVAQDSGSDVDITSGVTQSIFLAISVVSGGGGGGGGSLTGATLTWRGGWNSAPEYFQNDLVSYFGSAYIALRPNVASEPDTHPLDWDLVASKGDPGAGGGSDTAPADIYIATTGSDVTGDGTAGNPYKTLAKAISILPTILEIAHTIHIADGTYNEPINLSRFWSNALSLLKVKGNATTPTNVVFTGSMTVPFIRDGGSITALLNLSGHVFAELEGIYLNGTADHGAELQMGANLIFDRCKINGTLGAGLVATGGGTYVQFEGDCTIAGFSWAGVYLYAQADAGYGTTPGTLTITGSGVAGSLGIGMNSATFIVFNTGPFNLTVNQCEIGIAIAFNSTFTWQSAGSTVRITCTSTISANSRAVRTTDLSTWSTGQPMVIDHYNTAFEANSICWIQASGTRTITNVTTISSASSGSIIYLP